MAATLQTSIIQASGSTTPNLTLDTAGNATVGGMVVPASSFKRNKLINGSMNVYQRGSVNATTSGAYTLDRWFVTPTGATVTVTQSTSTVPTNFTASLNVAGAASVTNVSAYQRIESINCQELVSGAKVTVSGYIYQSTGSAVTTATVALTTPTASDNYTSTSSAATTYTIPSFASATWTYFNNTFTLTTGCTNGLQVTIALGTSLTTGSFNLTGLQAEVGSVATPYERQIYSDQLAQCWRYCYKLYPDSSSSNPFFFESKCLSGTNALAGLTFPQRMRAVPSLTFEGAASNYGMYLTTTGAYLTVTSFSINTVTTSTFGLVNLNFGSATTANVSGWLTGLSQNSFGIRWEAEL